jgi:hypothetical protein
MRNRPSIWPRGGLFAFSGIDGPTSHAEPYVAAAIPDRMGWNFWLQPRTSLVLSIGEERLRPLNAEEDLCLPDCWDCSVAAGKQQGKLRGGFHDRSTLAAELTLAGARLQIETSAPVAEQMLDDAVALTAAGDGWHLAACTRPGEQSLRFAAGISYASEEEAIGRALEGLDADLDALMEARAAFCSAAQPPPELALGQQCAYFKAAAVQKVNVESPQGALSMRWTTPDRMPHRHMWLWDSAFHAVGLAHLNAHMAGDALRALFELQSEEGQIALCAQPEGSAAMGEYTQPPIVAWAAWHAYMTAGDDAMLRDIYEPLKKYLRWFEEHRQAASGLFGWRLAGAKPEAVRAARGGESGMDNSPRFDEANEMTAVDLSSYMACEYDRMTRMALLIGNDEDAAHFGMRRAWIAGLINELLWDEDDGIYYDLDGEGAPIRVKTPAGLLPMLARIPEPEKVERLSAWALDPDGFGAPFPLATVARREPSYSKDMWRGPTWANMNLLVHDGLQICGMAEAARSVAVRTIEEIARWYAESGVLFEFYDAEGETPPWQLPRKGGSGADNAMGFGVIEDYHWTAAVYIHFCSLYAAGMETKR